MYRSLGKYDEALAEYEKCLKIQIKVFNGHDHTDVADLKYNIANLLEKEGKRDEARKLFLECEQILSKEVYGPDHSKTRDAAIGKAGRRVGGVRE